MHHQFNITTDKCDRFDATGNILEHYADGDLVNEDTPRGREVKYLTAFTFGGRIFLWAS